MIDWPGLLTIFLAITVASLVEHMVIAPRMEHSPPHTVATVVGTAEPESLAAFANRKHPNAVTI